MKRVLMATVVLAVVFMTISCATGVSAEEFQARRSRSREMGEIKELIERLSEFSGRIDALSRSINEMQSSIETLSGTTASKKELNQFEQRLEGLAAGVLSIFRCASRTSPLTQAMTQAKPPSLHRTSWT
jgi:peptidoglycan hydrolase CwlO-like protein